MFPHTTTGSSLLSFVLKLLNSFFLLCNLSSQLSLAPTRRISLQKYFAVYKIHMHKSRDKQATLKPKSPSRLISSAAHSYDFMRLHGVHAVCYHLVAMGTGGGDDPSVAWHLLQLEAEGAESQHPPHRPAQVRSCSELRERPDQPEWRLSTCRCMTSSFSLHQGYYG